MNSQFFIVLHEETGSQSKIVALHSIKVVVLEQSSGSAVHPAEWNHVVYFWILSNLSWLWFWAVAMCVLFWWYLFKSQWTERVTQGTSVMVFSAYDEIETKLQTFSFGHLVWRKKLLSTFLNFMIFSLNQKLLFHHKLLKKVIEHLTHLQMSIREHLPSPEEDMSWLQNPFWISVEDLDLSLRELKQLIDIAADRNLLDTFKLATVFEFCPEVQSMLYNNYCLLFQHNTETAFSK